MVNNLPADEQAFVGSDLSLHISLLGEFSLRHRGTKLSLDTPSYQSLLAYLIVYSQRVHSRQQLAFLFWPDSSESQARTNLRKALFTLRQTLPEADSFLAADRHTVQWCLNAPCVVDTWDFEKAVSRSQETNCLANPQAYLEEAISAYHGVFMPGHYDDWVLATRERLRQLYLTTLEKLLLLYENQRQYPEAISLSRELLQEDPLHEAAYRRLMRLQSLDGNIAGALRTYHVCSTRLQRDLEVSPSPATHEAYERLLDMPTPPTPLAPTRLPLVARKQAWQALQTAWKHCSHGQSGVVLLTGEAGIGKTRLAEELLDWAERLGIIALTAVCYPSEKQLAYAQVAKWFRSENLQPIFRVLDQRFLVECSRLLPELQKQHPALTAPSPFTESWQRQHLFSVLAQTLLQLRQPFLLFIDDLQWCDQDTLDWLHFLLCFDPQARFLLMGAARFEEITPDHPLIAWQQQLDRDERFRQVKLKRLNALNSAQLAGHVLKQSLDSGQVKRLYAETEGNPLFVVEMTRAGITTLPPSAQLSTLPPKMKVVIEARLVALSPPAYELAQLAAVIGRSFTFDLLNHACGQGETVTIQGLDELWQHQIVREQGVEAYDFSHDKIRQVAYESLSQTRRRLFHQRVWRALETLHADNLDLISGQIAEHCETAEHYQEAITYYHRAARAAQAVYANHDTAQYLERAIGLFSEVEVSPQQQIEIYEQLSEVRMTIGRYEEAKLALETAISLTTDPMRLSHLNQSLASVHEFQRHFDRAHLSLNAAEEALRFLPQIPLVTWWHEWLNIRLKRLDLYYFTNQIVEMIALSEEIRPAIAEYGSPKQHANYYRCLSRFGFRQERYVVSDETVTNAEAAYAAAEDTNDIKLLAATRFALAFAYLWYGWQGDLSRADFHLQGTLGLAEEIGDVLLRARCLNYLAVLNRRRGNLKQVAELLPKALLAAEEGDLQEYMATVEANLAWLRWSEGNLAVAKNHGQKALEIWRSLSIVSPLQWMSLWPLIDIALNQEELDEAVGYIHILLRPEMARLPDELMTILSQVISTYNNDEPESSRIHLQKSLNYARELGQL